MPHPLFISRAERSHIWDADGNEFVDFVSSWGPMILGWGHPEVVGRLKEQVDLGTSYGAPTELEVELARLVCEAVPSVELVRMVNSGTEATMSAVRVARGFTGREKIVKFIGCYHGHSDGFLAAAGSGVLTLALPDSPGVTKGTTADTLLVEYNDVAALHRAVRGARRGDRRAHRRAGRRQHGRRAAAARASSRPAASCAPKHGAVLIFDEVITGFRVAWGGAQERFGVMPDLTTLGKIIGGGLPGRRVRRPPRASWRRWRRSASTYQAGTLSGNPLAMAAGAATLRVLAEPGVYERLEASGARVEESLRAAADAAGRAVTINRVGPMLTMFFCEGPVHELRRRQGGRHRRLRRLLAAHARARRVPRAVAVRGGDDLAGAHRRGPRQGAPRPRATGSPERGLTCAASTRTTSPASPSRASRSTCASCASCGRAASTASRPRTSRR